MNDSLCLVCVSKNIHVPVTRLDTVNLNSDSPYQHLVLPTSSPDLSSYLH